MMGRFEILADYFTEFEPIHVRQHDVQDDQIGLFMLQGSKPLAWAGVADHLKIKFGQVYPKQTIQFLVIIMTKFSFS